MPNDTGTPILNLDISLSPLRKTNFELWKVLTVGCERMLLDPITQIERCGLAIRSAKNRLSGKRHITDQGYLLPSNMYGLIAVNAILDIEDNISGLLCLEDIFNGNLLDNNKVPPVNICYQNSNSPETIRAKGSYLYLPDFKRTLEIMNDNLGIGVFSKSQKR